VELYSCSPIESTCPPQKKVELIYSHCTAWNASSLSALLFIQSEQMHNFAIHLQVETLSFLSTV
jgi:hypothetical protein